MGDMGRVFSSKEGRFPPAVPGGTSEDMRALMGAVLAGGESRRMGSPKAGVRRADGKTLAEVARDALRVLTEDVVVLGHGEGCPAELPRLHDPTPGEGPLGGLQALSRANAAEAYVVVPCDLPALTGDVLRELVEHARKANARAAVFASARGAPPRPLPLYIRADALRLVEERFAEGERRLSAFVSSLSPLEVPVPARARRALPGANTLEELRAIEASALETRAREADALEEQRHARQVNIVRFRGEESATVDDIVAEEEPLELRVNGFSVAVTMRTPGHDEDLATGFLVTERVIGSAADIAALRHCATVPDPEAEENVLDATLSERVPLDLERLRRNLFASSSCGVCGKATLESALATAPPLRDDTRIPARVLYGLPERLREAQRVFASTGGLHAAALFDENGTLLVVREDVGRHNAVDKAIGWALRHDRLRDAKGLLVSGRVSFEVVQKAAAARVPLIAAISAPSSLAVRLGKAMNLTVVGFLRGETLNVYSASERVVVHTS